jgi:serine/threonine protein kinase
MEALERDLASTPYVLVRYLARGGMGEVVVVEHRELARQSVMKLLRTNLKGQEDLAERLRVEARLMAKLSHPNLVGILDFGRTSSGRPYLVTELLEGQPLHDLLTSRGGSLPGAEALGLARQVLAGLEPVHAAGFIHRDIKPANLFVSPGADPGSATLKILDFGIAKALSEKDRQALGLVKPTTDGTAVGTPSTMTGLKSTSSSPSRPRRSTTLARRASARARRSSSLTASS